MSWLPLLPLFRCRKQMGAGARIAAAQPVAAVGEQRKGTTAAHLWPSLAPQLGSFLFEGLGGVPLDPIFACSEHKPPP